MLTFDLHGIIYRDLGKYPLCSQINKATCIILNMETATDRQERISWWRRDLIERARVAVIGAGALGNEVLKNLALLGIGRLHVFDFDIVEISNLSRTVLFGPTSIGKSKAILAAERTKELNVNSNAVVSGRHLDIVWELGAGYLRKMDVVLGCLDNLEARRSIGSKCYEFAIPYIDGGIRELGGRIQLHKTGQGACMDCTIGEGERPALRNRYSCMSAMKSFQQQRVTPTVQVSSAFVGSIVSQEAVKLIQGKPVSFGSVISWFGETNDFDVLRLVRNPNCPTCSFPPTRPINELSISSESTAQDLFAHAGSEWSFILPSPFVRKFTCGLCSRSFETMKPSHHCKDTDFSCIHCNNAELIDIDKIDTLTAKLEPEVLLLSLHNLGIPPFEVLRGTNDETTALFELSADLNKFTELT